MSYTIISFFYSGRRIPWTTGEENIIKTYFKSYIKDREFPSGSEMIAVRTAHHAILGRRSISQIRSKMQAILKK